MINIPTVHTLHLIKGDELSAEEIHALIVFGVYLKQEHRLYSDYLANNTVALIFNKPSLRTRFSFVSGIQAAGGHVIVSTFSQGHEGKELPKDMIRVLQGYCDALVLRTHEETIFDEMIPHARIPIINGLSMNYHPCQILSDLMTIKEYFGTLQDIKLCFVGDGNNILHTFMLMAPLVGMELHYACPKGHEPRIVSSHPHVISYATPQEAAEGCHVMYTDVWTSMGTTATGEEDFAGYQIHEGIMELMHPDAVFMHCLPMIRGKEVNDTVPDSAQSLIFPQSHNRMYAQLALLIALLHKQKEGV